MISINMSKPEIELDVLRQAFRSFKHEQTRTVSNLKKLLARAETLSDSELQVIYELLKPAYDRLMKTRQLHEQKRFKVVNFIRTLRENFEPTPEFPEFTFTIQGLHAAINDNQHKLNPTPYLLCNRVVDSLLRAQLLYIHSGTRIGAKGEVRAYGLTKDLLSKGGTPTTLNQRRALAGLPAVEHGDTPDYKLASDKVTEKYKKRRHDFTVFIPEELKKGKD